MKTWLQQLERTATRWLGTLDHHTQPITTRIVTGAVFSDSHSHRLAPHPTHPAPITQQATPAPRTSAAPVPSRRLINKLRDV